MITTRDGEKSTLCNPFRGIIQDNITVVKIHIRTHASKTTFWQEILLQLSTSGKGGGVLIEFLLVYALYRGHFCVFLVLFLITSENRKIITSNWNIRTITVSVDLDFFDFLINSVKNNFKYLKYSLNTIILISLDVGTIFKKFWPFSSHLYLGIWNYLVIFSCIFFFWGGGEGGYADKHF